MSEGNKEIKGVFDIVLKKNLLKTNLISFKNKIIFENSNVKYSSLSLF